MTLKQRKVEINKETASRMIPWRALWLTKP